jgi:Guanine nucleotide exchange factor in Golgi transport N-terminal
MATCGYLTGSTASAHDFAPMTCTPAGTATTCALWQRVSSMQTIRQLCDDAALLHHLFVSYDMKWEVKLSAVQKVTETFADIIQAALAVTPESPEEDIIAAVAALFAAEAAGEGKSAHTLEVSTHCRCAKHCAQLSAS